MYHAKCNSKNLDSKGCQSVNGTKSTQEVPKNTKIIAYNSAPRMVTGLLLHLLIKIEIVEPLLRVRPCVCEHIKKA